MERILKPISEIMDEILIADTGSSDRTKEIAEQYTSQVFDFAGVMIFLLQGIFS